MCKKVFFIVVIVAFFLGQSFAVIAETDWNNHPGHGKAFDGSIAGVWEAPGGLATVTPLDPTGKRFSVIFDSPPPPFVGEYKFSSSGHGIITKIAPNLYDFSMRRLVITELWIFKIKVRGLTKFLDRNTRVCSYTVEVTMLDGSQLCIQKTERLLRMIPEEPCGVLPEFLDE